MILIININLQNHAAQQTPSVHLKQLKGADGKFKMPHMLC